MNEEDDGATQSVTGRVKWFDPGKGFGFVVSDNGGPDILLHANVLRNYGQSSVADSAGIEILVQETTRGIQAVQVLSIAPPDPGESNPMEDLNFADEAMIADTPLLPARVKWFDKSKGFGFANIFGSSDDVFVHVEVLRRSGLADLQPGEAMCLRVMEGKRGRLATQVCSWENAIGQDNDEEAG
ncbi:cold-shock DNA-binding domain-containing protein [Actibacterium atlanticum]|uniref:Cold-shock DNA-binding domain-containing protein n=1 Tax=Actibacterium atlanticum TaxID=1461693 RepID=A0A058ZPD2_9RHOB|nr:cold shock domain-containing protein [Actibacterium atlanticum]KCV83428.1 cold-shock DNA-binding domain-containing protein [Actibacterium atlanticum]